MPICNLLTSTVGPAGLITGGMTASVSTRLTSNLPKMGIIGGGFVTLAEGSLYKLSLNTPRLTIPFRTNSSITVLDVKRADLPVNAGFEGTAAFKCNTIAPKLGLILSLGTNLQVPTVSTVTGSMGKSPFLASPIRGSLNTVAAVLNVSMRASASLTSNVIAANLTKNLVALPSGTSLLTLATSSKLGIIGGLPLNNTASLRFNVPLADLLDGAYIYGITITAALVSNKNIDLTLIVRLTTQSIISLKADVNGSLGLISPIQSTTGNAAALNTVAAKLTTGLRGSSTLTLAANSANMSVGLRSSTVALQLSATGLDLRYALRSLVEFKSVTSFDSNGFVLLKSLLTGTAAPALSLFPVGPTKFLILNSISGTSTLALLNEGVRSSQFILLRTLTELDGTISAVSATASSNLDITFRANKVTCAFNVPVIANNLFQVRAPYPSFGAFTIDIKSKAITDSSGLRMYIGLVGTSALKLQTPNTTVLNTAFIAQPITCAFSQQSANASMRIIVGLESQTTNLLTLATTAAELEIKSALDPVVIRTALSVPIAPPIRMMVGLQGTSTLRLSQSTPLPGMAGFKTQLESLSSCKLKLDISPVLIYINLGVADAPTQLQEFVRYPIPTGTSLATATTIDGVSVYPSLSVFGSQVIRVGSGIAGSTDVSIELKAYQIGQDAGNPKQKTTMVWLRASTADTNNLQRALFGSAPIGPNITREASYASGFPRDYTTPLSGMNAAEAGTTVLTNPTNFVGSGSYSAPATSVLFLGSSLVRHNYNQSAVTIPAKNIAVATEFYGSSTSPRKLTKSRVESTVPSSNSNSLSPIYSSSAFRLLTPTQYSQYGLSRALPFKASAVVLPQDDTTAGLDAHIHGSDSMFSFIPIKSGVRHFYSYYRPTTKASNCTVTSAAFVSNQFTVGLLDSNSNPVPGDTIFVAEADCILRVLLGNYQDTSRAYIDIPVTAIGADPDTVIVDPSYRWVLEECLTSFASTHNITCLVDYYGQPNSNQSITSSKVLALSRPIADIIGDANEFNSAKLSFAGDRNLLLGEFSVAISRSEATFTADVKINNPADELDLTIYDSTAAGAIEAKAVSFFDTDKLHLFLKTDGTLAGRRTISTFNGDKISTNLNPILPSVVQKYISTGGTFSKVKVGESVIALLTTTNKLYLWGYNTYGHLDVPNDIDANFAHTGYIADIKDFDFHAGHIAVIKTGTNKLYGWGCKFSTSWVTPKYNNAGTIVPMTATAIKHLAIGENYSVGAVSKTINSVVTTVIEQFGSAPDAAATIDTLVLKEPTLVWDTPDIKVPAGKVLACGSNHTVALKSDGTVVCWGNNNTYNQCTVPGGLANVIAVDAGDNHSMALQSNGTVVCWGRDNSGQATVPANLKAKIISAGGNFCAAIRASNSTDVTATVGAITDDEVEDTVACWGLNDVGQTVVPKCEGVSYDPDVHKYRMRFWSVKCGWNHVAGVRKDDVPVKRTRDHVELNRYAAGADRTAFKLLKDTTTVFTDVGFGISLWGTTSSATITSNTGAAYTITIVGSPSGNFVDTFVSTPTDFISDRRYRLHIVSKASVTGGAALPYAMDTLKIQYATSGSPNTWIDLAFPATLLQGFSTDVNCTSNGAWPPTTCIDANNSIINLRTITRKWGIPLTQTSWVPSIPVSDPLSFPAGSIYEIGTVNTTLENILCSFETADLYDVGLDKKYVVWGSPQAYGVSANILDYQSYYPLLTWPGEDGYTPGNLTSALDPILVKDTRVPPNATVPAFYLKSSYSYVGLGPQLGRNTEPPTYDSNNLGSFFLDDVITGASRIYLGPTSLQIAPLVDGLLVRVYTTNSSGNVIYCGAPALTIAGVYFNRPTPLGAITINLYAGVESGAQESIQAIGFTNNAVYVERFTGSLPTGYSIVSNKSTVATIESVAGYHLEWTGSLPSIGSTTLTMTGAYCKFNESTNKAEVYLPFDDVYSGGAPIPEAWLSALSLEPRLVQIVKHQLDASVLNAADPLITPVKHMTVVPLYNDSNLCVGRSVYGLSIASSSTQRTDDIDAFSNFLIHPTIGSGSSLEFFPDNMYFGYRSYVSVNYYKYVVASSAQDTVGKVQTYTKTGGVNTNGQLNVKLGGPFGLTDALSPYYVQILSKSWMMDVAQWNIGHTQTPGLTYGFDKVSCSQFHTVALDMDGWVSAWGSNSAINPAATKRKPWTPYTDSNDGIFPITNTSRPSQLVSGWFTNFFDANYPGTASVDAFTVNRSKTVSSDIADPIVPLDLTVDPLVSGYYDFLYPADPSTVFPTYNANFDTNGFVFFNPNKFTLAAGTEVLFVKQKLLAPSIQMGLRNDNGVYRAYIQGSYTTYLRQYSQPLDGVPSLIYFGFDESNGAIPVITGTVKVDGTYIKWEAPLDIDGFDTGTDTYVSEPIYAISYSRSLNHVGTFPPPLNTDTLQRMYKPVTALTKLVAGDNFFSGLYLDEALPINKIRGTNVTKQEANFQLELGYNKTIDGLSAQGPPNLKLLDLVGPKENYLTLVERSYKQANLINPTTGVYASTVPTIASIRLEDDNFRIFLGNEAFEPEDTVIDYLYNYSASSKEGADVEKRVWPTVVLRGEALFNSSYSPKEIFIYRALNLLVPGTSYTSADKFNAARYTTGYVGNGNIDAKPLVDITSTDPLKQMVCYDSVSGRVLPQGYIPEANVGGGLLSIAMGSLQTAVIKASNNKIVSWGWNHFEQRRQLRDLVTVTPTKISSSSQWSLVLDSTGVKLITDVESFGQLTVPASLGAGTLDISTGTNFAAAIRSNGTVVCWGYESYVPEVPATLGACTKVACGADHVLVLKAGGVIACFGNNDYGQCTIPTAVSNGTVTHIACTSQMSVARLSTGVVYWWGASFGLTNNGNTVYACEEALGTNQVFLFVVKTSDKKIYCWPTEPGDYNSLVTGIPNVANNFWKLGQSTAARHMCAATDTTTFAWGTEYNIDGNYGAPSYVPDTNSKLGVICNPLSSTTSSPYKHVVVSTKLQSDINAEYALIPSSIKARSEASVYTSVELAGLKHAIAIAGGSKCWFAIYADTYASTQGTLIAWAADTTNAITTVPSGATYTQVSSRNRHAAARKANGDIVCWGLNDAGQATVPATLGSCTKVVCGDTFTVAIKDGGLLAIWGTIAGVTATIPSNPVRYDLIQFGDISCGIDHVVGTLSSGYSPGQYTWEIGTVVAFGNNDKGQCDIPGSLSGIIGNGVQCTAVAGGYFTSYSLVTGGFALANISSTTPAAIVAVSGRTLETGGFERQTLVTSDYIDGYLVHYSGSICNGILPSEHPFVVAYPTTTFAGSGTPTSILSTTGYAPANLTSNATNIPTAYRRNGAKRAKLITAGRYTQHVWTRPDHPFGAGYTVIVDKATNAIQMVGGDALPGSCSVLSYSPPIEKSRLYDVPANQLIDANIIQIGTFRGNTFALTSTGAVVQWGYQDSSVSYNISDPGLKQYIAVPDIALDDNTPSLTGARAFALAYVSGAPGLSDSWYVNVNLDRYVDGVKTNVRRFTATGNTEDYSIAKPVHFAETFLAVDNWPSDSTRLDSQYILSIEPNGVACDINTASIFGMNLDSKSAIGPVLKDASNMSASMSEVADYMLATVEDDTLATNTLTVASNALTVNTVSEALAGVSFTSNELVVNRTYVRNKYGSSAIVESVPGGGLGGLLAGRVPYLSALTPADMPSTTNLVGWYKSDTLPSSGEVTTWTNSVSGSSVAALTQAGATLKPTVVAFNSTSYKGAQFDSVTSNQDFLSSLNTNVSETEFTYFVVYNKTASTTTHLDFGKLYSPSGGTSRGVQGIGWTAGRPTLYTRVARYYRATSTDVITGNGILCGYYRGSEGEGLRRNGTAVPLNALENNTVISATLSTGYHLEARVVTGFNDSNDVCAEVVAFNGSLTDAQIQQVEGYLAHKFNLASSLPDGHPYKASPAVGEKLDVITPTDTTSNLILKETNRFTSNTGQAQTWVGMFEVGLNHIAQRTTAGGAVYDDISPVVAEFNIKTNQTLSILTIPVIAKFNSIAANLEVGASVKYLNGKVFGKFAISPVNMFVGLVIGQSRVTPKLRAVPAVLDLIMGMEGASVLSSLKFFSGADCGFYGCLSVSLDPPSLTILQDSSYGNITTQFGIAPVIMDKTVNMKGTVVRLTLNAPVAELNVLRAMSSTVTCVLRTSARIHNATVYLEPVTISPRLRIEVCVASFAFLNLPIKKYVPKTPPFGTPIVDDDIGPVYPFPPGKN